MRPPRLVAAADALTLACAAAAILLALFGAYRDVLGGLVISLRWMHFAFAAVGVALVRHLVSSKPTIIDVVRGYAARPTARPALRDAALAFSTRPAVLFIGLIAVSAIGVPPASIEGIGRDPLTTLPARFDTGWYAGIADEGYDWQHRFDRQQNLAFFPAYPLFMRAVGAAFGAADPTLARERRIIRYAWAGLFISLVAFFGAAWYFARLARELLDDDRATAALLLLAAYPFALFYSAAYTESLFLLSALGAWYHFRHAAWAPAAVWGCVAGLTRPNGFFLCVPLGLLALGMRDAGARQTPRGLVPLVVAAAPAVGMLLFTVYVHQLTDIWFAWARMHAAWGRSFSAEGVALAPVGSAAGLLQYAAAHPFQTLNALGLAFALALIWPVWRTLGAPWTAFIIVNIVPPLAAGGVLSMGRLTSTLFPLFLALAAVMTPRGAAGWIAVFACLQGLAATLFFTWRELF